MTLLSQVTNPNQTHIQTCTINGVALNIDTDKDIGEAVLEHSDKLSPLDRDLFDQFGPSNLLSTGNCVEFQPLEHFARRTPLSPEDFGAPLHGLSPLAILLPSLEGEKNGPVRHWRFNKGEFIADRDGSVDPLRLASAQPEVIQPRKVTLLDAILSGGKHLKPQFRDEFMKWVGKVIGLFNEDGSIDPDKIEEGYLSFVDEDGKDVPELHALMGQTDDFATPSIDEEENGNNDEQADDSATIVNSIYWDEETLLNLFDNATRAGRSNVIPVFRGSTRNVFEDFVPYSYDDRGNVTGVQTLKESASGGTNLVWDNYLNYVSQDMVQVIGRVMAALINNEGFWQPTIMKIPTLFFVDKSPKIVWVETSFPNKKEAFISLILNKFNLGYWETRRQKIEQEAAEVKDIPELLALKRIEWKLGARDYAQAKLLIAFLEACEGQNDCTDLLKETFEGRFITLASGQVEFFNTYPAFKDLSVLKNAVDSEQDPVKKNLFQKYYYRLREVQVVEEQISQVNKDFADYKKGKGEVGTERWAELADQYPGNTVRRATVNKQGIIAELRSLHSRREALLNTHVEYKPGILYVGEKLSCQNSEFASHSSMAGVYEKMEDFSRLVHAIIRQDGASSYLGEKVKEGVIDGKVVKMSFHAWLATQIHAFLETLPEAIKKNASIYCWQRYASFEEYARSNFKPFYIKLANSKIDLNTVTKAQLISNSEIHPDKNRRKMIAEDILKARKSVVQFESLSQIDFLRKNKATEHLFIYALSNGDEDMTTYALLAQRVLEGNYSFKALIQTMEEDKVSKSKIDRIKNYIEHVSDNSITLERGEQDHEDMMEFLSMTI